jgi:site-specific DNA recombinase
MLTIRREAFEEIVIVGLRGGLMDPDLFKAFTEAFHAEFNRNRIEQRSSRAAGEQELQRTDKRIRRILDLLLGSDDPPRSLMDDLRALEARKDQLEVELAAAVDHEPLFHPNLAEVYRQKAANLSTLLARADTQQEAFELIRGLIEVIRLIPEGGGQLRIELRGELAGILQLCASNAKKPGHKDPAFSVRQLKMVAGTGFEPVTFRL